MTRETKSGAKGIRTPDLFHAMEARYQLRHSPEQGSTIRGGKLRRQIWGTCARTQQPGNRELSVHDAEPLTPAYRVACTSVMLTRGA